MAATPVHMLSPSQSGVRIRTRICRMWRPRMYRPQLQFNGLDCILVDESGDTIQAMVDQSDYDYVAQRIELGCVYDISHCFTRRSKINYQVLPHSASVIFNGRTLFTKLQGLHPEIPLNRFYFADYATLLSRKNTTSMLSDVVGHITGLRDLEEIVLGNGRVEMKCDVYITNLRKENIRVTLWGNTAQEFDPTAVRQLPSPTYAVFTSVKVGEYQGKFFLSSTYATCCYVNLDLPEFEPYRTSGLDIPSTLKLHPPSAKATSGQQLIENATLFSVAALNVLEADAAKDTTILCRAEMKEFVNQPWWYEACSICYKQLQNLSDPQTLCPRDGQISTAPVPCECRFKATVILQDKTDETRALVIGKAAERVFGLSCSDLVNKQGYKDKNKIPPPLLQTLRQEQLFRLCFGQVKANLDQPDYLIQGIVDDSHPFAQTPPNLPKPSSSAAVLSCSTSETRATSTSTETTGKQPEKRELLFSSSEQSIKFTGGQQLHTSIAPAVAEESAGESEDTLMTSDADKRAAESGNYDLSWKKNLEKHSETGETPLAAEEGTQKSDDVLILSYKRRSAPEVESKLKSIKKET